MARKPKPKKQARDHSVRGLPPPSGALRSLAGRLGCEVYDGRRAAAEQGFQLPPERARGSGWPLF